MFLWRSTRISSFSVTIFLICSRDLKSFFLITFMAISDLSRSFTRNTFEKSPEPSTFIFRYSCSIWASSRYFSVRSKGWSKSTPSKMRLMSCDILMLSFGNVWSFFGKKIFEQQVPIYNSRPLGLA